MAGISLPTAAEGWTGVPLGGRHEVRIAQHKANETALGTHYIYDAQGRLTDVWLPAVDDATIVSTAKVRPHWHYDYDGGDNQTGQTDPNGHMTTFAYDELGRRISRTLPGGATERWTYDKFGRVQTHVDFKGQISVTAFDPGNVDRVDNEYRFATGVSPFDEDGQLVTADAAERTHYDYDTMGRAYQVTVYVGATSTRVETTTFDPITGAVASVTTPEGVIHYEYDPATGQLSRTYTSASDISYDYDDQGRLWHVTQAVRNGATLTTPEVTTYAYDEVGNLHSTALANGDTTTYEYDTLNRLTKLTTTNAGNFELFEQDYTLLSNGQRDFVIEKRFDGVSTTPFAVTKVDWNYDDDGRLIQESRDQGVTAPDGVVNNHDYTDDFTYDLNGNRESLTHAFYNGTAVQTDVTAYAYDARDELTSEGADADGNGVPDTLTATTHGYDANGSMTSTTQGTTTTAYVWDLRNRLAGVDANNNGSLNDSMDSQYRYDSDGVRVGKVTGGATTAFLIDKQNPTGYAKPIEERDANGDLLRSYVLGHDVLFQADGGGSVKYLLKDGHGTTRGLLNAGGSTTSSFDFAAFGDWIGTPPANAGTTFLQPDGGTDGETGFTYSLARYRKGFVFISRDPAENSTTDPQTLHKYLYALGGPIARWDPSGLASYEVELGKAVHKALAEDFVRKSAPWGITMISIFSIVKVPYVPAIGTLLPDLVYYNLGTKKEVFEIKPDNIRQILLGYAQLAGYVIALNKIDPAGGWDTGSYATYTPPATIVTTEPAGFVLVTQLPGGLITYLSLQQYVQKRAQTTAAVEGAEEENTLGIAVLDGIMGGV